MVNISLNEILFSISDSVNVVKSVSRNVFMNDGVIDRLVNIRVSSNFEVIRV